MPLPLLAIGGALAGSELLGAGADWLGGNAAADAQRKAQRNARNDLTAGYGQGMGFQQPIYDTALGNYQNLSNGYAAGNFNTPHMNPFSFDPQSVFQDPEYQAQMRAGTESINSGAQSKGMLFSGNNARDLTRFGHDLFAGRSDALYKRGNDAQNTAFNQNLAGNAQNFGMGMDLANPLGQAAGNLTDLAVGQGQDLANNSTGMGNIRAQNINNTANAFGGGISKLGGIGSDLLAGLGKKK
jgi:hypothetical protein